MRPIFKIGDHDYTAFLAVDGLSPTRNSMDGPSAGRDIIDGYMERALIGQKWKWVTKFNRLPDVIMRSIAEDTNRDFVQITFLCPEANRYVTRTFYNATLNCGTQKWDRWQGTYYDNCTFDVTER